MKKKKVISLLIASVLVVGGAVGTYAWFTDSEIASANLVINTGTLKIDKDTASDNWVVSDGNNSEIENKSETNNYTNVRPGDSFERTFTIQNTGSLSQTITVDPMTPDEFKVALKTYGDDAANKNFKGIENILTLDAITVEGGNILEKGQTKIFKIKVTLNGKETTNLENNIDLINWENKKIDLTQLLKDLKFITVDATQTNAN
ncbi:MAG: TasA family protein [Clostridium sp.]|uniref:TasA family protein n=1 Tax=Clostridium sp. TaxID=1506 RepID=UPI00305155E0